MMKNILSIDFDFFQLGEADIFTTCYPDGVDLPTGLSNVVWASHLANPVTRENLMKIRPDVRRLRELEELIRADSEAYYGHICNSHKEIYDEVCANIWDTNERITVYNIDMHADVSNDNEALDCGNWVSHLKKKYPKMRYKWIANECSRELFGLVEKEFDIIPTELDGLKGIRWDMIFLCRSDNWSLPLFDRYFIELAEVVRQNCWKTKILSLVMEERMPEVEKFCQAFSGSQEVFS